MHGPTSDGGGVNVLRARKQRLEIGTMRPLEHGRPINGEVVKLTPRPEMPHLYDAETEFTAPSPTNEAGDPASSAASTEACGNAGPAQVASDTYRKNWDAIWKRTSKGLAN